MTRVDGRLSSAQVRWNDYVGTAAADDADVLLNRRSLYEIAALDRDQWEIVGIDFSLGGNSEQVVVYGAERAEESGQPADPTKVSVTAFYLASSVRLDQFLQEAFKRVSVRLLSSKVSNREVSVVDRAGLGDLPESAK